MMAVLIIKRLCFILFIIIIGSIFATAQKSYRAIDKRVSETPASEMTSITRLAQYLTATAKDDYEKARAIYGWIAHSISYSDSTGRNGWLGTSENKLQQQAENVLKNRSAVCEGFANLYKALCEAAGLPAEMVTGVVKQEDGTVSDVGHAWNAVQLEGEWYLTDPTWGSGYVQYETGRFVPMYQEAYFLIPASKMIQSHLPDDPIWQLLPNPLTEQEFRSLSVVPLSARVTENAPQPFAYQDSIALWFRQDSLQRMLHASERVLRYNPKNPVSLARLGNHFYNEAVRIVFRVEEQVLQAFDEADRPLDTTQLLLQLVNAEQLLQRGWYYYKQVENEKLIAIIEGLAPETVMEAELNYLRGLIGVWEVKRLYQQLNNSDKKVAKNYYDVINTKAQHTQYYFTTAAEVYANHTGALYEDALHKAKLHQALLYNYVAKANGTILELTEATNEAELNALAERLDRGEAAYQQMLSIVQSVVAKDPMSVLGNSLLEESPLVLAALYADRGFVQQFTLFKKYQRQWDHPELLTKKTTDEMIQAHLKCNDYADQAAKYLTNAVNNEATDVMKQQLRTLQ
ncbi:MAG: transglutaminase domain-containing protein, partial [Saprospiraceae bacterium]